MYVCMCMYVYVCMYVYMYVCMYVCMYVRMYERLNACVCMLCTYEYMCVCSPISTIKTFDRFSRNLISALCYQRTLQHLTLQFYTSTGNNMEDSRTCEVVATLAPLYGPEMIYIYIHTQRIWATRVQAYSVWILRAQREPFWLCYFMHTTSVIASRHALT
jgi:hypothetical protein